MNLCAVFILRSCGCLVSKNGEVAGRICDPCFVRRAKILERQVQGQPPIEKWRAA